MLYNQILRVVALDVYKQFLCLDYPQCEALVLNHSAVAPLTLCSLRELMLFC